MFRGGRRDNLKPGQQASLEKAKGHRRKAILVIALLGILVIWLLSTMVFEVDPFSRIALWIVLQAALIVVNEYYG